MVEKGEASVELKPGNENIILVFQESRAAPLVMVEGVVEGLKKHFFLTPFVDFFAERSSFEKSTQLSEMIDDMMILSIELEFI